MSCGDVLDSDEMAEVEHHSIRIWDGDLIMRNDVETGFRDSGAEVRYPADSALSAMAYSWRDNWPTYSVSISGPGFFMSSTNFSVATFGVEAEVAVAEVKDISGSVH